ncbi:MAG: CocE/NonD family hydrolase, partial [Halobacteria archaeon]|nr:CocE/NonD family hydrolase [Halobacteria archaeon]
SWDGTPIAATVYEPNTEERLPAVLMTHGWGMRNDMVSCHAERYATNGYVALAYDSRGFGQSGGVVGLNGPKEQKDVSALIDWLADRDSVELEGCNPTLGGGVRRQNRRHRSPPDLE